MDIVIGGRGLNHTGNGNFIYSGPTANRHLTIQGDFLAQQLGYMEWHQFIDVDIDAAATVDITCLYWSAAFLDITFINSHTSTFSFAEATANHASSTAAPYVFINQNATVQPKSNYVSVVEKIIGPGTFDWNTPSSTTTLKIRNHSGNYPDHQIVYANHNDKVRLKLFPRVTPQANYLLSQSQYDFDFELGYEAGAVTTGDFIARPLLNMTFNGGFHLNPNAVTSQNACGSIDFTLQGAYDCDIYGPNFSIAAHAYVKAVDVTIRSETGSIAHTSHHDPIYATTKASVQAVSTDITITGLGFIRSPTIQLICDSASQVVSVFNLRAHDNGTGTLHIGENISGLSLPGTFKYSSAHVNHVSIGDECTILPTVGQHFLTFIGTCTRTHEITDKGDNVHHWTSPSGESVTHYGTSSLGAILVQAGQPLTINHHAANGEITGFICDSLTSHENVDVQCRTGLINGGLSNGLSLSLNSATFSTEHDLIIDHSTHTNPVIVMTGACAVNFGDVSNAILSTKLYVKFSNTNAVSLDADQTIMFRNSELKTFANAAADVLIRATQTTSQVVVQNSKWNGAHGFCGLDKNVSGRITRSKFTQTAGVAIITGEGLQNQVQTGFFEIAQNIFVNTTADYPLIELNGTWVWDNIDRNVFKFTGSANSKAIQINANQTVTNYYSPIKSQSFIIPSNVGPVSADGQTVLGSHCFIPTNVSEVGNHGATTESQVWSHVNGTNRSVTMLGGNLGGNTTMEVLRYGAHVSNGTISSNIDILVENDKTYYTSLDETETVHIETQQVFMSGLTSDEMTASWSERNTDHPVSARVMYVSSSGSVGGGGTITNGGRIDNLSGYTTAVGAIIRFTIDSNPLAGVGDIVITNVTQGGVVFSDHITYKPSRVNDGFGLMPANQQYKLRGAWAPDSTTLFPTRAFGTHGIELRPKKPEYVFIMDRADFATGAQYHIRFGYQDEDNYYVARFHISDASNMTLLCQLWKKVAGTESQVGTDASYTVNTTSPTFASFGLLWTPGSQIEWIIDGSTQTPSIPIIDFTDGAVGFETRQSICDEIAVFETEGFTARNTDLIFSSGSVYSPITNGIDLYNCSVNMNAAAIFPTLASDEDDMAFEETTFADGKLLNVISSFIELRSMNVTLDGDIILGENGKLHMSGCILQRPNEARWIIDTRGVRYTDSPPVQIRSCQLRGIYTTFMKDGELWRVDDAADNSHLIRIYARKEMRVSRNRVLGLDFSRSITDGFQSNEQDFELQVVDNMSIPGKLHDYFRTEVIFESISPYCYEWKSKIVAYRHAIIETANVAHMIRFTVEEWRDD